MPRVESQVGEAGPFILFERSLFPDTRTVPPIKYYKTLPW